MTGLVYDLAMQALTIVETGKAWELWDFSWDRFFESDNGSLAEGWKCKAYNPQHVRESINEGDKKKAEPLLELAKQYMKNSLKRDLQKQIDSTPSDLYANWQL